MTHALPSQKTALSQKVCLPSPAASHDTVAVHLCTGFLHHYNGAPGLESARIQAAITALAKQMAFTPAVVAQKLVEQGLFAGPECFPEEFLTSLEKRAAQPAWVMSGASAPERALMDSWRKNGQHGASINGYKQGLKI